MSQFRALELVEAWVVGLLQATQVLWTMVLSVLVLGHEEHITAGLIFNVLLILLGVGGMIAA
jgi:drug/metabolite transporter (DMT)-like permease